MRLIFALACLLGFALSTGWSASLIWDWYILPHVNYDLPWQVATGAMLLWPVRSVKSTYEKDDPDFYTDCITIMVMPLVVAFVAWVGWLLLIK